MPILGNAVDEGKGDGGQNEGRIFAPMMRQRILKKTAKKKLFAKGGSEADEKPAPGPFAKSFNGHDVIEHRLNFWGQGPYFFAQEGEVIDNNDQREGHDNRPKEGFRPHFFERKENRQRRLPPPSRQEPQAGNKKPFIN